MTKILCSAILVDNDLEYEHQPRNISSGFVVCGMRHHNCFTVLAQTDIEYKGMTVQGFLTVNNNFVTREEAGIIALMSKQIEKLSYHNTKLYSEDLY